MQGALGRRRSVRGSDIRQSTKCRIKGIVGCNNYMNERSSSRKYDDFSKRAMRDRVPQQMYIHRRIIMSKEEEQSEQSSEEAGRRKYASD
jgi:hypothetical protein